MNFEETFEFNNIGRCCELTKYVRNNSGNVTEIEIPSHVDGKPVTRIGDRVFKGAWLLESIRIPDTVTEIGDGAFNGAYGLRRIRTCSHSRSTLVFRQIFPSTASKLLAAFSAKRIMRTYSTAASLFLVLEKICFEIQAFRAMRTSSKDPRRRKGNRKFDLPRLRKFKRTHYPRGRKDNRRGSVPQHAPKLGNIAAKHGEHRRQRVYGVRRAEKRYFFEQQRPPGEKRFFALPEPKLMGLVCSTEITARLLEYKKQKFGFNGGETYEL